jgi:ribonuclease J
MPKSDELVFLPLGGSGEIGMNFNAYGFGPAHRRQWIVVDCGITFGRESETPGVDIIMPDIRFLAEQRETVLGIVATHAHEDHIGAIAPLWPSLKCPIYATPFTARLIEGKLAEAGLSVPVTQVPLGGSLTLGPFAIDFISITHSILEPNLLAIRTPLGVIAHTGDWKIDPEPVMGEVTNAAAIQKLGDEGVLALVCDSTNALVPGHSGSEAKVRDSLSDLIGTLKGRVAVTSFASNVARLDSIAHAARTHGRKLALVGRSMHKIVAAARDSGYLGDFPATLDAAEASELPARKVLYLVTGSQGEPRAALGRIAEGNHPDVQLGKGDTVIFSSRIIPGNELPIFELHNKLAALGVEILTAEDHFVHVSGHPARDELVRMYQMVRPKIAIPVHGEARHLIAHAQLAGECQVQQPLVIQNGDMVRLASSGAAVVDEVTVGRLASDGKGLLPLDGAALKDRRRTTFNGTAVATLALDRQGRLVAPPAISLIGMVEPAVAEETMPALRGALERLVDELPAGSRRDDGVVRDAARRGLRRILNERFGKRPLVEIHVVRI